MGLERGNLLAGALALTLGLWGPLAHAETKLRVFIGGQQRPDVVRPLLDRYQAAHPGVSVELEVGGATSDLQQQYLTTVLGSGDSAIDVMLIDVVRQAQYAAAGWAEPLDPYLGDDRQKLLADYLPVYAEANQVGGRLIAMPAFADALFLYYRKDLLEKHGLAPPRTWDELKAAAKKIQAAEGSKDLQGISFQGKPIEGAVCTFLVPYWGAGGSLADAEGRFQLDRTAGEKAFDLWLEMISDGIAKKNVAEVATDDTRKEFQAGNVVFAVLWAYGWSHFQNDPDSRVKDKVGVVPLPGFAGGPSATCIGGWEWAVSAFSEHKQEAAALVRFLSGPEGVKHLAIEASNLPVLTAMYQDPEVLATNPWFKDALSVVESARARPKSPRYPEISEVIRVNVNAVLAGVKAAPEAVGDMDARLSRLIR
ncbi:ABC transporter substrate-binding protein [Benzoatithermus flavus]|uniref:ABC transporter substrate-binding protein n=1 Tax=Benzoatithermus flavus TaxID=3108223 RepID=A0ABU8XPN7_9PROT